MPASERPSVLLVEDSEQTASLVVAVLQNEFQVETANRGSHALDLMLTRDFASVLLDLKMPELDGYEVLARIRDLRPEVLPRVVIFTAALTAAELERVREFSVWGVVRKPFELETLRAAVRNCAGNC